MNALIDYFKESLNEIKLVTWPKEEELLRLTIISVIFVIIAAIFLGLIDFSFSKAYQWLLSLGTVF